MVVIFIHFPEHECTKTLLLINKLRFILQHAKRNVYSIPVKSYSFSYKP